MKCKRCKFARFNPDKTFSCSKTAIEMNIECLLRNIFFAMLHNVELSKKAEKLIDKTTEEMDEGEKWKE